MADVFLKTGSFKDDYPIHNSKLLFKTQPYHLNASVAHQDIVVARRRLKPAITFLDHRQNLDSISGDTSNIATVKGESEKL